MKNLSKKVPQLDRQKSIFSKLLGTVAFPRTGEDISIQNTLLTASFRTFRLHIPGAVISDRCISFTNCGRRQRNENNQDLYRDSIHKNGETHKEEEQFHLVVGRYPGGNGLFYGKMEMFQWGLIITASILGALCEYTFLYEQKGDQGFYAGEKENLMGKRNLKAFQSRFIRMDFIKQSTMRNQLM